MDKKVVMGAMAGVFDPWLRKLAQRLADSVPEESVFRSQSFEMAIGVAKGFVEAMAEKLPPTFGVLIEKATDIEDFFAGALRNDNGQSLQKIVNEWQEGFLRTSGERLKNAENPQEEFERLKVEFELRNKFIKIMKEEMELNSKQLKLFPGAKAIQNLLEEKSRKLKTLKEDFEQKEGFRTQRKEEQE